MYCRKGETDPSDINVTNLKIPLCGKNKGKISKWMNSRRKKITLKKIEKGKNLYKTAIKTFLRS